MIHQPIQHLIGTADFTCTVLRSTLVSPQKIACVHWLPSNYTLEKVPHSSPIRFHCRALLDCCVLGHVKCLSSMTCSSHRSMYDPDLKLRRRDSMASVVSFVRTSANCPVGTQRITQPVFFKDSRIISTSMAVAALTGIPRLINDRTGAYSLVSPAPCRSNGP